MSFLTKPLTNRYLCFWFGLLSFTALFVEGSLVITLATVLSGDLFVFFGLCLLFAALSANSLFLAVDNQRSN